MAKSKSKQLKEEKDETVIDKPSANNEIDDIFATKKIATKSKEEGEESPTVSLTKQQKRKQKKKKATAISNENENSQVEEEKKKSSDNEDEQDQHKVQEVIFSELAAVKKNSTINNKRKLVVDNDDDFADSRGKKAKRTTDDGYPLYDVKDLRIGEGKDTPECPFDCQCCF
ncbi:hypothetical protein BJ944DRAFT_234608 [Cunninghamella echinulata]|nr:hypothetical protein BJ944DRAFT_234608 [Cunninghamella echinulata]